MTPIPDWATLVSIAFADNLDIYVRDLLEPDAFCFLDDALEDGRAVVSASKTGGVVGIQVRQGRAVRTICRSETWGYRGHPGPSFLSALARLFDFLGEGVYPTPASLGEAMWRRSRAHVARISCPSWAASARIRETMIGGRVDTPALGRDFPEVYEQDLCSAYVSLAATVPAGTEHRIFEEPIGADVYELPAYYARCEVTIPIGCAGGHVFLGPVPLRADSLVCYPTKPGVYGRDGKLWLWREEVELARAQGYRVRVYEGFAWPYYDTRGNDGWIRCMTSARANAPDEVCSNMIKRAGVAAIGRMGMGRGAYVLKRDGDPTIKETDIPLAAMSGNYPIQPYWLSHVDGPERATLPHWFSYIVMSCRVELYGRMMQEVLDGNEILASNFDAFYTRHPTLREVVSQSVPGKWKEQRLTHCSFPAPRAIESDQKRRRPGVRREDMLDYA